MNTFTNFGLNDDLLEGLSSLGFQEPTPIQSEVIPLILDRRVDLVGLAQTGTGKTAAFGLPLIQRTNIKNKQTQCLVLCPTRELCVQVAKDLEAFSKHIEGLRILPIYGGASIDTQIKKLSRGVQIIVATPGRLNDLINRRKVDISKIQYVVIDEADELLQMGFQDELNAILDQTSTEKNTLLFSATMSKEISAIAAKYMFDPVEITIGKRNAGAEKVHHEYYMVHAKDRYLALKRIVDNSPDIYSIIFCRTRLETQKVADSLIQDGYNADALHGDLSQAQRDMVMNKFRRKNLQLLVATDVAARGLDVNDLTHVINYNLPDDLANYTHRSGRTGRAGRTGISVVIIHMRERFRIRAIEKKIKKQFKQCHIPSGMEICKNQLVRLVEDVTSVDIDHDQIDPLYEEISKKLESLDREEIVKRFVSLEFNRFLAYYKNAPDLNVKDARKKSKAPKKKAGNRPDKRTDKRTDKRAIRKPNSKQKFTRFFLNVGRRDGILPQGLIGKINAVPGMGRIKIGKIDIMRKSALLEADSRFAPEILNAFQHYKINGKTVSIEVVRDRHDTNRPKPKKARHRKGRRVNAKAA